MRILGVDPGSLKTGWALLEGDPRKPRLVDSGVVRLPASRALPRRLGRLQEAFEALVVSLEPNHAAVEAPFHGKSSKSALHLAHARGVILGVLDRADIEIAEYSPATVKKSVTGYGRADKEQVRTMVARLVDAELATAADDLTDAVAVALCHFSTQAFDRVLARSPQDGTRKRVAPRALR